MQKETFRCMQLIGHKQLLFSYAQYDFDFCQTLNLSTTYRTTHVLLFIPICTYQDARDYYCGTHAMIMNSYDFQPF